MVKIPHAKLGYIGLDSGERAGARERK